MDHWEFGSLVATAWSSSKNSFSLNASEFAESVKVWSKNCFDNIFHKKRKISKRLLDIQKALEDHFSQFLVHLESTLLKEFNDLLVQEKDIWALKARTNSILWDEVNTKFLQTSTIIRRKHNKILVLRNDVGDWIIGDKFLKIHSHSFFNNLFTTSCTYSSRATSLFGFFRVLDPSI
ncbi:hypothetical protein ACH5RR_038099 [Cinchona calisaya]|uniref:Uncharacterized protein n=1 Tax=Cinchona calisaya TaxID=153742 RepID=A0ABD2YCV1_9GENT